VLGPKRERRTSEKGKKKHSLSPPIIAPQKPKSTKIFQSIPRCGEKEREKEASENKSEQQIWMGIRE
jgi:hypothetical protein